MSNNIQLKCTFSEEAYIPDSVVSVALQPSIVNSAKLIKSASSYRIHLQAVSYVVVDNRWAKLSSVKEFFSDSSITSNKSYCSSSLLHLKKSLTNQNFFISYVSNVVSLQLDEFFDMNGVMLQFNLYSESFCSIKSLSCSVNHCITASIVSMQTNYDDKVLIFPFQVFSYGSILKPHKAGCCNLYSIPIKAFHHSNILLDTFRNGITDIGSCNNKIFQIQDQAVICRLSFLKSFYNSDIDTYQCYPGNLFEFKFDFSCARQGCQYIRIMLIQSEYRVNDSKVQDKILATCNRCCLDIQEFSAKICLPDNAPCSCENPITKISYSIVFEFSVMPAIKTISEDLFAASMIKSATHEDESQTFQIIKFSQKMFHNDNLLSNPLTLSIPLRVLIPKNIEQSLSIDKGHVNLHYEGAKCFKNAPYNSYACHEKSFQIY